MADLDLKDRKILYQLDLNCRRSNTQIGKKVGLSRKVVDYRIKQMEEKGIITGYWTEINSFRLGYDVYRYYITFQNATQKIKDEMIGFLIGYENLWTVYSASGVFDLGIVIWVKDVQEFYKFWEKFNDTYGDYILEKKFSVYLHCDVYRQTCLIPDNYDKSERELFIEVGPGKIIEIDKLDYELLSIIVLNAKTPLIEIASQLDCSSQTINYRLKNLMGEGVIKAFRVGIDYSKIGLQFFAVSIWLRKLSKRKEIWEYLRYNPYVTYINTSAGFADLQIEIVVDGLNTLQESIEDISEKFPDAIRKYNYITVKEQYIMRCLPKMKGVDFKKT